MYALEMTLDAPPKAMPNWNYVKRQLKFDKPRYLFTNTHKPKTKTQVFYENNNRKKPTTLS